MEFVLMTVYFYIQVELTEAQGDYEVKYSIFSSTPQL